MKQQLIVIAVVTLAACTNSSNNIKKDAKAPDHSMHNTLMNDAKGYCDSVNAGIIAEDKLKGSPERTAMTDVHGTHVHIEYNSPGVKGRTIWGGLVPYDQVWVTGAHRATRVNFYKDVMIADKKIPKGIYAIFTIPGKTEWIIILNRNYNQHLTDDYSEKDDIVRVTAKPEEHGLTPRLTYGIEELTGNEGVINILWEKIKVSLFFKTI